MSLYDNLSHLKLENKPDIQSVIDNAGGNVRILHIYLNHEQYSDKKERLKGGFYKNQVNSEDPSRLFENITRIKCSGPNEPRNIECVMTSMDLSKLLLPDGLDKSLYPLDPYLTKIEDVQSTLSSDDDSTVIIKIYNNTNIDKRKRKKKNDKGEEGTIPLEASLNEEGVDETRQIEEKMNGVEEDEEKVSKVEDEEEDEEYEEYEEEDEDEDEEEDEDDNKLGEDGNQTKPKIIRENDRESLVDTIDDGNGSSLPFLETETEKYITPMVLTILGSYVSMDKAQVYFSGFKLSSLRHSVKFIQEYAKNYTMAARIIPKIIPEITPNHMIKEIDLYYVQNSKKTKPHREIRIRNDCRFDLKPTSRVFMRLEKILKSDDVRYEQAMRCVNKLVIDNNAEEEEISKHSEKDEDTINQTLYKQPFFNQTDKKISFISLSVNKEGLKFKLNFDDDTWGCYVILPDFVRAVFNEEYDYLLKDVIFDICQHTKGLSQNLLYISRDDLYTQFDGVEYADMKKIFSFVHHHITTACGHYLVEHRDKEPSAKKRKIGKNTCDNFSYRRVDEGPNGIKEDGVSWVRINVVGCFDEK